MKEKRLFTKANCPTRAWFKYLGYGCTTTVVDVTFKCTTAVPPFKLCTSQGTRPIKCTFDVTSEVHVMSKVPP